MFRPDCQISIALTEHPLYFILDDTVCGNRDPLEIGLEVLGSGIRLIQLRLKNIPDGEFTKLASRLAKLCRQFDALLIVNDRLDAAMISGADGIHIGPEDFSIADVRSLDRKLLIGVSARTIDRARSAQKEGADYIGCGAVFRTDTKLNAEYIGVDNMLRVARSVTLPVIGIGGITPENVTTVRSAGADGFCAIGAFRECEDIPGRIRDFEIAIFNAEDMQGVN